MLHFRRQLSPRAAICEFALLSAAADDIARMRVMKEQRTQAQRQIQQICTGEFYFLKLDE